MKHISEYIEATGLVLTAAEIRDYTGRNRYSAQARVLSKLQVPFKQRPDGSLIVLRVHVNHETQEEKPASPRVRPPKARRVLLRQG